MPNSSDFNNRKPKVCAVIAAAGKSSRMNFADKASKQFIEIGGKTVIEKTVTVFDSCGCIDEIIIAARYEDIEKIREIVAAANLSKIINITAGGETRQESVFKAINTVGNDIDFVAIHDGARCFISHEDIEKVMLKAFETGAAAAGTKVTDTIKLVDDKNNIIRTVDRGFLWAVQTPQVFKKDLYFSAMKNCTAHAIDLTDDCAVVESIDHPVSIVECSKYNIKITDMHDLIFLKGITGDEIDEI